MVITVLSTQKILQLFLDVTSLDYIIELAKKISYSLLILFSNVFFSGKNLLVSKHYVPRDTQLVATNPSRLDQTVVPFQILKFNEKHHLLSTDL